MSPQQHHMAEGNLLFLREAGHGEHQKGRDVLENHNKESELNDRNDMTSYSEKERDFFSYLLLDCPPLWPGQGASHWLQWQSGRGNPQGWHLWA